MAMLLQYQVGVIGEATVHRALAGIERRFVQHQQRLNRTLGPAARATGAGGAASSARRESAAMDREQQRQLTYWRNAHVQSVRARMREEDKRHRSATRNADKETRAAQASAKREIASRRRFSDGAFGKVSGSVRGTLGAVGRFGGAAMGLAGGFAATNAVSERIRDTKMASRLANQAGQPGLKKELLTEARGVRGLTSEQVLSGQSAFMAKTGDIGTAREIKGSMAELSLVTGADFTDLMTTAGQAFNVLNKTISDPTRRLAELNSVMAALAQQGAIGAIEMSDLARDFGKLGAATSKFEGGSPDLLRSMGALAQIAVQHGGADTSADASTAAARMANDMVVNRNRFDAILGPDSLRSKTNKTKLRRPEEIMMDVIGATGGDIMKTTGLFGQESGKIFSGMSAVYSAAEGKKKGSGREAMEAEYKRYSGATLTPEAIKAGANSRLEDPDLLLQETVKKFNAAVADQLLPVLMQLLPEFTKLLPHVGQAAKRFAQLASAFAQDPIGGLTKLIAAKLAFDVAASSAASAGQKLAASLTSASGSIGGASTGLGGAIAGAQLGIAAAAVIIATSIANFEKGEADMTAGGKDLNRARELGEKAKTGVLTSEETKELRDIQIAQGKRVEAASAPGPLESGISAGVSALQYGTPIGLLATAMGLVDSDKIAQSLVHPSAPVEQKTHKSMAKEIDGIRIGAEIGRAAREEIVKAGLNRTDSPSPVKPHS